MKTSAQKWPRVLVGCPTYSGKAYCLTRYAERVKSLDYPNYDVLLADNSDDSGRYRRRLLEAGLPFLIGPVKGSAAERVAASRDILREYALQNGYDYFFNLEQDVIPPGNILKTLVSHRKDVVGGWYYIGTRVYPGANRSFLNLKRPCVFTWKLWEYHGPVKAPRSVEKDLTERRLLRVMVGSFGAALISRKVLELVKFCAQSPVDLDDVQFYRDLYKKRIPAFVDSDLLLPHFQDDAFRAYRWSSNARLRQLRLHRGGRTRWIISIKKPGGGWDEIDVEDGFIPLVRWLAGKRGWIRLPGNMFEPETELAFELLQRKGVLATKVLHHSGAGMKS